MKKHLLAFFGLALLLAGCGGGGVSGLTVSLVDGMGEPLQPQAAAWRVASFAWNALPTGQSNWTLPLPAGSSVRFTVAFRCPAGPGGGNDYVSLEAARNEVGNHVVLRCPYSWANSLASVSGSTNLTGGNAYSARGANSINSTGAYTLQVPTGSGREVAVFDGTNFGRSGPFIVPGNPGPITASPSGSLSVTTPPGFFSGVGLALSSFVQLPLQTWNGGSAGVPRPGSLAQNDLFIFWTNHGYSHGIWRYDAQDPAVAPGASLNLSVPPLNLSVSQTHSPTALPTFTGTGLSAVGFSSGLTHLGYALVMSRPAGPPLNWYHFLSPGGLAGGSSYYLDLQTAPGFTGVVPGTGDTIGLCVGAFAGDQPLATLLATKPLPHPVTGCRTLFLDRQLPVHLEEAAFNTTFTW